LDPATGTAAVAGTAGPSASSSSSSSIGAEAPVGSNAAWVWIDAALLRARRVGPRSAFIRPTSDSPSPEPLAAGLDRSISAARISCAASAAPAFSAIPR